MCRITVHCHCRDGGGGWIGLLALAVLGVLGVLTAPVFVAAVTAAVDLLTAIVIGLVAAVGIAVAGWIAVNIAVSAIEERSLRRHNERMAQIHPNVRAHLERINRPARPGRAIPTRQAQPVTPVPISPTPRRELAAGRHQGAV